MSFQKNVFINCPFDNEYKPLREALIFTVIYLGYEPQIAITTDSGSSRIDQIKKLISNSQYSIHDISRCEPLNAGDLPRFNMPYEMGLDLGCREFGSKIQKTKKCLILDKERHRYDTVISDISGQDIRDHNNEAIQLVEKVREWFSALSDLEIEAASKIWAKYTTYNAVINTLLVSKGHTQKETENLSIADFIKTVKSALKTPIVGAIHWTSP